MTQNADNTPNVPNTENAGKIQDHFDLFHTDTYQDLFEYKRQFEAPHDTDEVARIAEWTKSWDG
jgi:nitrogenase molybdenum-iron protein beta chain